MITLSFLSPKKLNLPNITEEWSQNITISIVSKDLYLIQISVEVEDSSYRYRALMQRPQLVLKFSLPYFVEFPVGTSCVFQNQTFTLNDPENLKKQGSRKIEYTMTLGTKEDNLANYKLRNSVDGRLKWSMCAKPHEFIEEIVKTLNKRDGAGVWFCNKSNIIKASEKTIEFNHVYCDSALSSVAETFETEYEVIDHGNGTLEIALHKVEYFKTQPLPLSYGRGNGFVPGVGRTTEKEGQPIKRLYVQGGERNIDRSKYGTLFGYSNNPGELRLPKSQTLEYEGREYTTDAQGYYIERSDSVSTAVKEDSLDCSEIYPSYIGKVTGVTNPNPDKNFYDIIDSNIPDNLNFNNYLIAGENMTLIFQSGMLAGREFEVKYKHTDKRWELVPMEEDGITFPNETFKPHVNTVEPETYAIFGIMLPNEYICDNESKTGASWDMFREGARYLYEHEDQSFTFSGELQGLYAKRHWLEIGGYLKVGAYIHFTDDHFAKDGIDIRIIGVKDYVNNPYSPTLEISNSIQSPTTVSSQLHDINNSEVYTDETRRELINFTKRRFRDAKETAEMLAQAALDNFSEGISPITVQTMSALIGDESLQFEFFRRLETIGVGGVIHFSETKATNPVIYSNSKHQLSTGIFLYLRHLTLGIKKISSEPPAKSEYKTWKMTAYTSPVLSGEDMASKGFFLYARCAKDDYEDGTFVLSDTAIAMESEEGYYHFLVGILTSMQDGERSYANLFGFTEILPGRITTDIITTAGGESFFDLASNRFKLGNKLSFNLDNDDKLRLAGTMVQSASGSEFPLPCYRGAFSSTTQYYAGDMVSYTSDGITSMYICISNASSGIVNIIPTDEENWRIFAKGVQGIPGVAGKNAPIMTFQGNYDSTAIYYGNSSRVDAVKYGGTYYIAKTTAPNGTTGFAGAEPSNSDYWLSFGASFESVATALLLAEKATIGNWFISGDSIASTHGTINGVESDDFTASGFRPDVVLDGATGELVLYSDKFPRVRISNASVTELFNETLVSEASINRNFNKTVMGYIPYSGSTHRVSIGLLGIVSIGHMNEDSKIKINSFGIDFSVPGHRNISSATINASINGVDVYLVIKRNGVAIKTLTGTFGVSKNKGERISIIVNPGNGTYIVPEGGEGNFSIELYLQDIGFTSSSSGQTEDFTIHSVVKGEYTHGGFNRTVIGNDGIGSFWEDSVFVFSKSGLITRFGSIGFKVSKDGIQRSNNANLVTPTWTNL